MTATKTVEFVLPTDVLTLAAATRRDLAAITLYIPESSITFRSVEVEVTLADDITAAATIDSWLIGIKLGAVAFDDVTESNSIFNSGEAQSYKFARDVTSYFTTNWSGASMTCQVGLQFGTNATQNHSAKLRITYDYDETSTTHVKTIRVPIESTRGLLTTTFQTVGGATAIPAFGGSYLPEASVVVRQAWVELWGNEALATNGDFIANLRVNGGTSVDWWDSESALRSARFAHGIVDITAEDLTAARSLECSVSTTTNRMAQVGGMVCVTYEFAPGSSSTIFNSILIGGPQAPSYIPAQTSADQDALERIIYVEEPTTITLKESAVCAFYGIFQDATISMAAGAQSATSYLQNMQDPICGQVSFVHRIDAGGQNGTAFATLARGRNELLLKWFAAATGEEEGFMRGLIILNYTSGKASAGVHAHNQTRHFSMATHKFMQSQRTFTATPAILSETNYLLQSVVFAVVMMGTETGFLQLLAERGSGEGEESGWEPLGHGEVTGDLEAGLDTVYLDAVNSFRRWPGDPDADRLDVESSRSWILNNPNVQSTGIGCFVTYHSITFAFAGTISGSAGGTVNINVHRASDGEKLGSTSRSGNGSYSFTWFDDTENLFSEAREDSTHIGRSDSGVAA